MALIALGVWMFFPPAEYVMGGKDPGVYLNEGIQIAQRGSLVVRDPVIGSVLARFRDMFYPQHERQPYYGLRFMGFYILDPAQGTVVGQFPHLYRASIAIGYGIDGLTGARRTSGFWAILGLVTVYVSGSRLFGRRVAFAGALLLAVNVIQISYARYRTPKSSCRRWASPPCSPPRAPSSTEKRGSPQSRPCCSVCC